MKKHTLLLAFLNLLCFLSFAQNGHFISLTQNTEVLENAKKNSSDLDLYFDKGRNTITKHIHHPDEVIVVSNELGEMKIYYPKDNQVAYKRMANVSSKRNLIYYFANNMTDQLGLGDEGFRLSSTEYENGFLITTWKAPPTLQVVDRVKMVFEQGAPIFAEYLDASDKTLKKTYYTHYQDFYSFRLPLRITEIVYKPSGDSIINRTLFSNIEVSNTANNDLFNYKIPEDAKAIPAQ